MTLTELLRDYYDREMNNVFCYSANYLMNSPRRGYEKEWHSAKDRAELLRIELENRGVEV